MANKLTFTVQPRKLLGKKTRQLRTEKLVPGNIYGLGHDSVSVKFPAREFRQLFAEAGETGVVYLQLADKSEKPVLIDEIQVDPVNDQLIHVSFKEVDLTQEVEADVPVELVGEFEVKGAVLVQVRDTIAVRALPTDLPEKFVVDVAHLTEVGQMVTLGQLDYDRDKVALVELETAEDAEKPVVLVQEQREEEPEEEAAPEDVEITEEGQEKAEGEATEKAEPTAAEKPTSEAGSAEKKAE